MIKEIITAILLGVGFCGLMYLVIRNNDVLKFRLYILDLVYNYEMTNIEDGIGYGEFKMFHKLPSYVTMVFSFRPLVLEEYYTQEELVLLDGLK